MIKKQRKWDGPNIQSNKPKYFSVLKHLRVHTDNKGNLVVIKSIQKSPHNITGCIGHAKVWASCADFIIIKEVLKLLSDMCINKMIVTV